MACRAAIPLAKIRASSGWLSRSQRKATPTIREKITTAMVLEDRVPAKSAKMLVGKRLVICWGRVRPFNVAWWVLMASMAVELAAIPLMKLAPWRLKARTLMIPMKEATAVVERRIPKTLVVIFFRFVCFFSLVKAPTRETKTRGITSICSRAM